MWAHAVAPTWKPRASCAGVVSLCLVSAKGLNSGGQARREGQHLCPLIFLTLSSFIQDLVLETFLYSPCLLGSDLSIRNLPCAADSVYFTSLASNRDVSKAYDFRDLCISVSLIIYEIRRQPSRWSLKSTLTFYQEVKHSWLGWSWTGLTTSSLG